jgi:signal transduction histidine kinase
MPIKFIYAIIICFLCVFEVQGQASDGVLPDTSFVESLLEKARQYQSISKFDSTLILAKQADSISTKIYYKEGEIQAAIVIAGTYLERKELKRAEQTIEEVLENYPNAEQLGWLYKLKGEILYDQGDIVQALSFFQDALDLADQISVKSERERFLAVLHQALGNTYQSFGKEQKSYDNYIKAIDYAKSRSDSSFLVVLYNNLGIAYWQSEELDKAQYYLDKSKDYANLINSKADELRAYINLANVLRDKKQFQQALEHYEKAEVLWRQIRPNAPPAIIIHNKGVMYSNMNEYEASEELLKKSLQISRDIQLPQGIYFNHLELSRLYEQTGDIEKAVFHIDEALPLAKGSGSLSTLNVAQQQAEKIYAKANQFERAYNMLLANREMNDSLNTIEKEKEISQLKSTLEVSRQQEINDLLEEKQAQQEQRIQVQNFLIAAAVLIILLIAALLILARRSSREKQQLLDELEDRKEELEQLNQAKDRVFAIVAHDLRSPLTSVQGVLELVKDEIVKGDDLKRMVHEIDLSIKENVNVIEDLLAWAKDQLSGMELKSETVEIKSLIKDLLTSQSFLAIRKNITLESKVKDHSIKGDSNATRIIFRNLISNAVKYTEQGDTIEISASEEDDSVIFEVKDNGIGIPKNAAQKIFNSRTWSREGTKKEKGSGFGLSLSKEFTEKMGGKIWFESDEKKGTTFYVKLPKAK